jgi:bifunctional enzyme CysN/CysC
MSAETADLRAQAEEKVVRISTAGSVDDGKSTLIGRLLYDSKAIMDDQFENLEQSSQASGEDRVNLALLTDGLRAEREQKITIDVAYRYFSTPTRRFIIADTPGHTQYTRNMVTGASTADVAILLLDAERGITDQSKRHAFIASLLHVPHVLVAVNKMDLVGYSESRFQELVDLFSAYAARLSFVDLRFVPISALEGDNVVSWSERMPWHTGPALLQYLESVHPAGRFNPIDFRFPVQVVLRPNASFRGFAGQVVSGAIRVGEEVMTMGAGLRTRIASIRSGEEQVEQATVGQNAVLTLTDEIDISRGEVLVRPRNPATACRGFEAMVCWMGEAPLELNRTYVMVQSTRETPAFVDEIVYRLKVEDQHREKSSTLELNDIGRVSIRTANPVFLDLYEQNRATGSFLLVDAMTDLVAACGMVSRLYETRTEDAPRSATGRRGLVVWLTGLSGAGKSTLSAHLRTDLEAHNIPVVQIDGDGLRAGLCADLGFGEEARNENIRRAAELAKMLAAQGLVVVCSLISPLRSQRQKAADIVGSAFSEVFVECTVEQAIERDPKGLYQRALRGEIKEFTGISSPYERPETPALQIDTGSQTEGDSSRILREWVLRKLIE